MNAFPLLSGLDRSLIQIHKGAVVSRAGQHQQTVEKGPTALPLSSLEFGVPSPQPKLKTRNPKLNLSLAFANYLS